MDLKINFTSAASGRQEIYASLLPQLRALVEGERDTIANLANITSAVREAVGFHWVGFYIVRQDELVLGPFQGPVACTRIGFGKGVCGKAWKEKRMIRVDDVDAFPGHIACSPLSKSEIVIPVMIDGNVKMVLDIDSIDPADFDEVDEKYLGELAKIVEGLDPI